MRYTDQQLSGISVPQLLDMIFREASKQPACDEILRRADRAGQPYLDWLRSQLSGLGLNPGVLTASSGRSIRDIGFILRQIRRAEDVGPACRALLTCGWDFVDPGIPEKQVGMNKSPREVQDFLESLCEGLPPVWHNMDDGRRNLLNMIIDAYFRALKVQELCH